MVNETHSYEYIVLIYDGLVTNPTMLPVTDVNDAQYFIKLIIIFINW